MVTTTTIVQPPPVMIQGAPVMVQQPPKMVPVDMNGDGLVDGYVA